MPKTSLSAQQAARLINGFRRNAALAEQARHAETMRSPEHYERLCIAIAHKLAFGGRPDIAHDLFAETFASS